MSYPLFEVSGHPQDLGRQHGEQAGDRIRQYLDDLGQSLKLSREQLRQRALQFLPLFAESCPDLLREVEGLAEGARLTLGDALAVQLRGELGMVNDGGCTSFAIGRSGTAEHITVVGQTSDNPPNLESLGYVLRMRPIGKPALIMWTFGGMLGYHGINEHGVSHFANALGGGPKWKFALSHYPLKRLILEQRSVEDVIELMRRFPVCSNGNYMLADGKGSIADVELTSDGPFVLPQSRKGYLVHSNHFLCSEHACESNWQHSLRDSFPRLSRLEQLIENRFGSISLTDVQRFLSDHEGHPVGICRHPRSGLDEPMLANNSKTVAALIAEPENRRIHVAFGNPCENPFLTWSLD